MTEFIIVYTTFPEKTLAKKVARTLIEEKLIACSNIFRLDSLYTWKNKLQQAVEYGAFMKTGAERYTKVEKRIRQLHPYDCPEIIQIPIAGGYAPFLSWIAKATEERAR